MALETKKEEMNLVNTIESRLKDAQLRHEDMSRRMDTCEAKMKVIESQHDTIKACMKRVCPKEEKPKPYLVRRDTSYGGGGEGEEETCAEKDNELKDRMSSMEQEEGQLLSRIENMEKRQEMIITEHKKIAPCLAKLCATHYE